MKINYIIPKINSKTLTDFIKKDFTSQSLILKENALMLDQYTEKDKTVNLYFLEGFFVEETVSGKENKVIDILPFKQGYKIEKLLEKKGIALGLR